MGHPAAVNKFFYYLIEAAWVLCSISAGTKHKLLGKIVVLTEDNNKVQGNATR